MQDSQDVSREFQERRQTKQRLELPWIAVMLVGWICAYIVFFVESLAPRTTAGLFLFALVLIGGSIIRITFIMSKHYRCPVCDQIPIAKRGKRGVLLDPEECPTCGAMLK